MLVVIGYESMYGNTHRIADAVAAGFTVDDQVTVMPIAGVDLTAVEPDVLIVGVPTHAHGLPGPNSRRAAIDAVTRGKDQHALDGSAAVDGGAREWLAQLPTHLTTQVAVFDTRFRPPAWLVGRPSRRVGHVLTRHGARLLASPESFFVDKHEQLLPDELERARAWGTRLRERASATAAVAARSGPSRT
ncbi:MAG TPA: flavodoxin domain-containing protein [Mycobacteriales bacterium]|jgi:hypothetical protein|nr:flavodoxin domain-containing protein [Mycobacteriales bacterium]